VHGLLSGVAESDLPDIASPDLSENGDESEPESEPKKPVKDDKRGGPPPKGAPVRTLGINSGSEIVTSDGNTWGAPMYVEDVLDTLRGMRKGV